MEATACPAANVCAAFFGGAPECGTVREHLPRLVPAEDLCISALERVIDDESTPVENETSLLESQREQKVAEYLIEAALSPDITDDRADDYLDGAEETLEALDEGTNMRLRTHVQAGLLDAYLPAFEARRNGELLESEELVELRAEISALMAETREAPVHSGMGHEHINEPEHVPCESDQGTLDGLLIKLGFHSVCLRAGLTFYPATSRETGVCDGYLDAGDDLVPVKVQSKHRPLSGDDQGNLLQISFRGLANSANIELGDLKFGGDSSAIAARALAWLEQDGREKSIPIGPAASTLLDGMTDLLQQAVAEHKVRLYES